MAAASGKAPAPTNLSDRLAALRQRQPAGVLRQLEGPGQG
jgi:hypothetical protein